MEVRSVFDTAVNHTEGCGALSRCAQGLPKHLAHNFQLYFSSTTVMAEVHLQKMLQHHSEIRVGNCVPVIDSNLQLGPFRLNQQTTCVEQVSFTNSQFIRHLSNLLPGSRIEIPQNVWMFPFPHNLTNRWRKAGLGFKLDSRMKLDFPNRENDERASNFRFRPVGQSRIARQLQLIRFEYDRGELIKGSEQPLIDCVPCCS